MPHDPRPLPRSAWVVFAAIAVYSLWMISRSQVDGDAMALLFRGWSLAHDGVLIPYGNPLSAGAGGYEPGPMTSLLVGVPMMLWLDYRAPSVLILLFHLASWLILDRVMREAVSRRERLVFFLIYGLSPWRMFFSGFVWNPNYLYLAGAVHLWACWRQRETPAFGPSAVLAAALGLAVQLHPSTVILGFATVVLLVRRRVRLHWGGVAVGALVAALTLVPWVLAVAADPSLLPGHAGDSGRSVWKTLHNVLRGLSYWFSLPSLAFPTRITLFDFGPTLGAAADRVLRPIHYVVTEFLFEATALPVAWIFARTPRRRRRRPTLPPRDWLKGYAGAALLGGLVSFVAIPTTIMMWQLLVVFHASVLLMVLRLSDLRMWRGGRFARAALALLLAGFVWIDVAASVGSPAYRKGGYAAMIAIVRPDDPMVSALGIDRNCLVVDFENRPPDRRWKPTWRGGEDEGASR